MRENSEILLSMSNIRKQFPGVLALDDVHFDLKHGEVHTLIGETLYRVGMRNMLDHLWHVDDGLSGITGSVGGAHQGGHL